MLPSRSSTPRATTVQLYPDVLPALQMLRRKYRLFALSNGNADLERIGLAEYFERHVTARAAGALKPDPRVFRHLLDACGVEREHIVHIGDDPEADIRGAQDAGVAAVWINRTASVVAGRAPCARLRRMRPGRARGMARRVGAPLSGTSALRCQRGSVRRFAIHHLPGCTVFANFGS